MTNFEKIYLFNTLCGRQAPLPNSPQFYVHVSNQASRVLEEVQETIDDSLDENLLGVIDGVADVMVTALGLYQQLQRCGVDVEEALSRVCDNNLTKFHRDPEEAQKTLEFYQKQNIETFVRMIKLEDGEEYYGVLRKSDQKLLKPYDFKSVDLFDIAQEARKIDNVE